MPEDIECQLRKELEAQIRESEKWFDKIRQIDHIVRATQPRRVHVGGSKAPGLLGATPSPFQPIGMSASAAIQAIQDILSDN